MEFMKKNIIFGILFSLFIENLYCVEIKYTLLNETKGSINVPNDIIEINAFKGNMNFVRNNGEIINIKNVSLMTEITGIENLPMLNKMELALQLSCNDLSFLKSNSLEYLLINWGAKIDSMEFLNNFPNLKYLGLQSIEYNNNIMDLKNTLIKYFIVSYIRTKETIKLLRNNYLEEFICFYSDIKIDNSSDIKIINNYNDFIGEMQYFELFHW
jgi:hypothetical protein